jgi:methenyltetrahydrofolate cyclohydrolase
LIGSPLRDAASAYNRAARQAQTSLLEDRATNLSDLSVRELTARLASREPVPGGGSASALSGALAAALVAMVGELTVGRPEAADHRVRELRDAALARMGELVGLAQDDAAAYAAVVEARRMARGTDDERLIRREAMDAAILGAAEVPLQAAETAAEVLGLAERMAPIGNPNAVSDVGVAAELAAAAVRGAALNVRINLPYLPEQAEMRATGPRRLDELETFATTRLESVRRSVAERISPS